MKITLTLLTSVFALTLAAQGPPPGHGRGFGWGGPEMMHMGLGPQGPVTGVPFSATAVTQMQQTLADGNQISRTESMKISRDSQGRVRTEITMPARPGSTGQAHTMISIFDPVAGTATHLNADRQTAEKMTLPQRRSGDSTRPPRPARADGPQMVKTDLGSQTVNGLAATGARMVETIPAGAFGNQQPIEVVREVWTSAELGVPVMVKVTDPRSGTRTMQLTNIVRSEPEPSLFQVPAAYKITTRAHGLGGPAGPPPPEE